MYADSRYLTKAEQKSKKKIWSEDVNIYNV